MTTSLLVLTACAAAAAAATAVAGHALERASHARWSDDAEAALWVVGTLMLGGSAIIARSVAGVPGELAAYGGALAVVAAVYWRKRHR